MASPFSCSSVAKRHTSRYSHCNSSVGHEMGEQKLLRNGDLRSVTYLHAGEFGRSVAVVSGRHSVVACWITKLSLFSLELPSVCQPNGRPQQQGKQKQAQACPASFEPHASSLPAASARISLAQVARRKRCYSTLRGGQWQLFASQEEMRISRRLMCVWALTGGPTRSLSIESGSRSFVPRSCRTIVVILKLISSHSLMGIIVDVCDIVLECSLSSRIFTDS